MMADQILHVLRPGVHGESTAGVAAANRRQDPVHRAGQSLGKWLLRELHGTLRDELLNGEIFYSLKEARIVIERWRHEYNEISPHSSLGYRPPGPAACSPRPLMLAQPEMVQ